MPPVIGRLIRWVLLGLVALLVLVPVLGLGGFVWLRSETGLAWLSHQIETSLPGGSEALRLTGLSGSIPWQWHVQHLELGSPGEAWLTADDLNLRFDGAALLRGALRISSLDLGNLALLRAPPTSPAGSPSSASPSLPRLPLAIELGHLGIDRITLDPAVLGTPITLRLGGDASLHQAQARLDLTAQRIDALAGLAELHVDYGPAGGHSDVLQISLHAAEPSGVLLGALLPQSGPLPLALDLGGAGPLEGWRGRVDLLAGATARLSADLALDRRGGATHLGLTGSAQPGALVPLAFRGLLGPGGAAAASLDFAVALLVPPTGPLALEQLQISGAGGIKQVSVQGWLDPVGDQNDLTGQVRADLAGFAALTGQNHDGFDHDGPAGQGGIEARLNGALKLPRLTVNLGIQDLALADYTVKQANAAMKARVLNPESVELTGTGALGGVSRAGGPVAAGIGDTLTWSVTAGLDPQHSTLILTAAQISGAGLDLTATGGWKGGGITGHLGLKAGDLSRFAGLVGLPLSGAVQLQADATSPDQAALAARISGQGQALHFGVPVLDAALGPRVSLDLLATRAASGALRLDRFALTGAALTAQGTAEKRTDQISARFSLTLPNLTPLGPALGHQLAGTAILTAEATGSTGATGLTGAPVVTLGLIGTGIAVDAARIQHLTIGLGGVDLQQKTAALKMRAETAGVTLQGSAGLSEVGPETLAIRDLLVTAPGTSLRGAAVLDGGKRSVQGRFVAEATDLSVFTPMAGVRLAGRLQASLDLTPQSGQGLALQVTAAMLGLGTGSQGISLQSLTAQAALENLLGAPKGEISVEAKGLAAPAGHLDRVHLQAHGDVASGFMTQAALTGVWGRRPVSLSSSGTLRRAGDRDSLSLAEFAGKIGGLTVHLDHPADFWMTSGETRLGPLTLALGAGSLTAAAVLSGPGKTDLQGQMHGRALPLTDLANLAGHPELAGTAQLNLDLKGNLAAPTGQLDLSVPDLKLSAVQHPDLPRLALTLTAGLQAGRVDLTGGIAGPHGQALTLSGRVPLVFDGAGGAALALAEPLRLAVTGATRLENLAEILPLGEDRLAGLATLDLAVTGSAAHPEAAGSLTLRDGQYDNNLSGMTLRGVSLDLVGDQQAFVLKNFSGNDGGNGQISGGGRVDLGGSAGPMLDFTVKLADFTLARRDEVTATAGGSAAVTGPLMAPSLTGDIVLKRADINIPEQLPPHVATLKVVRIDSAVPAPAIVPATAPETPGFNARLGLHLHVPGQCFVRGRGLDSEWRGELSVAGTSLKPSISGQFTSITGSFAVLGQNFQLDHGTISFEDGGSIDPRLDILAKAETADITALVLIGGVASQPSIKISSSPELPQDEILSRVLFGSAVGQITPAQALQLAQAAASLAGGGPGLLQRLRAVTGLDRLSVGQPEFQKGVNALPDLDPSQNKGTTSTTVSGGKYVAPGVFVGVDQGTGGEGTKARVELELSPHLTVSGTAGGSSTATSIGVMYRRDY